jgi:hypothetical protein
MNAIILHPTQGEHVTAFQGTAYHAARESFGSKAAVFGTHFEKPSAVTFKLDSYANARPNPGSFWEAVKASDTFVWVGHSGYIDGPILARHAKGLYDESKGETSQPWGVRKGDRNTLDLQGMLFWSRVGKPGGGVSRIILLGCDSGDTYAGAVAKVAQCDVYGYVGVCPAGDWAGIKPVLNSIRNGGTGGMVIRKG